MKMKVKGMKGPTMKRNKGKRGLSCERKGTKNDLRIRVHPQNASRDARGLFGRPIVRQTKVRAWRESQHAARDERHESKQKKTENIPNRADNERARRTSTEQETQRHETSQKQMRTKENVVQREAAEDGSMAEA
jgi:hypothetical protein